MIRYQPKNLLRRLMSEKALQKVVTQKLTINKAALKAIAELDILSKRELEKIALKVIKDYKRRFKNERKEGASIKSATETALSDKRLMVQRIRNATVHEITQRVKEEYSGEYYEWLPSTAANPDPKHMKKYGKRYRIGRGEAPGDRYGCQCGMLILTAETRLKI